MDRLDFEAALLKAVATPPIEQSRLLRVLADPACPSRLLRRFALGTHWGARQFLGILATLANHAPDEAARSVLLQNLMSEEGVLIVPGIGLVQRTELRHTTWSTRFAVACGVHDPDGTNEIAVLDAEMEQAAMSPDRWLHAVAFFLLGQEGTFAKASQALADALGNHGFSEHELAFFHNHAIADEKHGKDALELVINNARTIEQQQLAIHFAHRGAQQWLSNYR